MTEKVVIPAADQIEVVPRRHTQQIRGRISALRHQRRSGARKWRTPARAIDFHVTGLTHDERGYPNMTPQTQDKLVRAPAEARSRCRRAHRVAAKKRQLEGADVIVVSYGITSRVAQRAIEMAREQGLQGGQATPASLCWPFPRNASANWHGQAKAFVVPELNLGQMVREVERAAARQGQDDSRAARRRQRASSRRHSEGDRGGQPMSTLERHEPGRAVSCALIACRTSGVPACGIGTTVNCFARRT